MVEFGWFFTASFLQDTTILHSNVLVPHFYTMFLSSSWSPYRCSLCHISTFPRSLYSFVQPRAVFGYASGDSIVDDHMLCS